MTRRTSRLQRCCRANDLSQLSTEALQQRMKAMQTINRTAIGIFAIIVLAWIVLGYWRDNTPVFISTVVLAVGIGFITSIAPRNLRAEIERRQSGG